MSDVQMLPDYIFISIDCAYRSLGWCILRFAPNEIMRVAKPGENIKNLLQFINGDVVDVLDGKLIEDVDVMTRARALHALFTKIHKEATDYIAANPTLQRPRIITVIEHQPRHNVHDTNQAVEAQTAYHFTIVNPVDQVYLVNPSLKNKIACRLLNEAKVKTYPARKAQSRRAFVRLSEIFNFDARLARFAPATASASDAETSASDVAASGARKKKRTKKTGSAPSITYKNTKADLADAYMQIIATIFIAHKHIDV